MKWWVGSPYASALSSATVIDVVLLRGIIGDWGLKMLLIGFTVVFLERKEQLCGC